MVKLFIEQNSNEDSTNNRFEYSFDKDDSNQSKSTDDLLKQKDWNSLEVHAIANHYYVWLNGLAVLDYTLKNANLIGPVGLQLHPGKTMNIQFKNIFLKTL